MGRIIKVKKGDTTYSIKLYDTEAETGTPVGTATGTLKLRIDGANHYARISTNIRSDIAGGATPLRYKKSDGTVYQVTQKGEFSITVPSSYGQTVCVNANGQTFKGANTLWFAEGTVWNAYVEADSSHIAGSLNVTGGTLNSTVTLSVTPAAVIPSGSKSFVFPKTSGMGNSDVGTFTVPSHITVLHIQGTSATGDDLYFNNTYNVKVTPGKTYPITGYRGRYKVGSHYGYKYLIKFNGLEVSKINDHDSSMLISWSSTINTYGTDHDFS